MYFIYHGRKKLANYKGKHIWPGDHHNINVLGLGLGLGLAMVVVNIIWLEL